MSVTSRPSIKSHSNFISFCVETAEWIGLQRNAGVALATLYIVKGSEFEKLSAEDIASITGYSRSNVSLVLSQLESKRLVRSTTDNAQIGRGRKKILYSVGTGVITPLEFAVLQVMKKMKAFTSELETIEKGSVEEGESLRETVHEFKEEAELVFSSLTEMHLAH
jgi:DNA-binding transcriptional regulator GbsR (MarR family)